MMADKTIDTIERLEELSPPGIGLSQKRAGSAWVWEARLVAAEELERRADLRAQQRRNAAIRLRSRRVVTSIGD